MEVPCLGKDFVVIRCTDRRIDVFRYSGNTGAGGYYSGNLIFTQNLKQRAGKKTGSTPTGDCDLRDHASGDFRLRFMAGVDGSIYATMGKGSFPLSFYRNRPGSAFMANLLGVHRISEEMTGYRIQVAGHWMLDKSSLTFSLSLQSFVN